MTSLERAASTNIKLMCCVRDFQFNSATMSGYCCWTYSSVHNYILCFNVSEQKERAELIEMDPNLLLLIMMIIVLYFFTKICLAVITASQQTVFATQAPALIDFRNQGAIQSLEDITRQVEEQTINRRAENRVRPQPQENNEWNS